MITREPTVSLLLVAGPDDDVRISTGRLVPREDDMKSAVALEQGESFEEEDDRDGSIVKVPNSVEAD